MKGYVQVYTGDGKGKTTAALGLALRAVGAGKRVYIAQFVKGMKYSELNSLKRLSPDIEIHQYGLECFIYNSPTEEDIKVARDGFEKVGSAIRSGIYDLVVIDEGNIATYYELFTVDELIELLGNRPEHVEVVITGRNADKKLIEFADLVTEMKEIKHYYTRGIQARVGIEK